MKNKKLFYIFMFLPLVMSIVALLFMPEVIPTHYNIENIVDRWGSKYEILIFPILTILYGQFFLFMVRIAKKQEVEGNNNEKNGLIIGICLLVILNIISGMIIYRGLSKAGKLSFVPFEYHQILFFFIGIILIFIGNLMPKLKKNSVIGFRTENSLKNDEIWKKCQQISGITIMISGALISIFSLMFHNVTLYVLIGGVLLLGFVVDLVYSYKVAK